MRNRIRYLTFLQPSLPWDSVRHSNFSPNLIIGCANNLVVGDDLFHDNKIDAGDELQQLLRSDRNVGDTLPIYRSFLVPECSRACELLMLVVQ